MKVKIKTWKQMEKEFGLTNNEHIQVKYRRVSFNFNMEDSLPKDRIIEIEKGEKMSKIHSYNIYIWYTDDDKWHISDDMIEEIIEE
jgi:hypothetical protein